MLKTQLYKQEEQQMLPKELQRELIFRIYQE